MSTTPTTPQWAIEAAKRVYHACFGIPATGTQASQESVALLAKEIASFAPPLSPPTDEAKLREVIRNKIQLAKDLSASGMIASEHQITTLTDRILAALAPHLSQREPGDSAVYEVVDSSNDEQYWTLGIFLSKEEALSHLNGDSPPYSDDDPDSAVVEVRERRVGFRPHDFITIASRTWSRNYDDMLPDWTAYPIEIKSAMRGEGKPL